MRLVRCVAQRPTSEGSAVAEDTDSTRDPLDPIPDVDWAMEMGDAEDGLGPISYDQASTSAEAGHTRVMPVAAPGARMYGTQPSLYRRDSPSAEHGYATAAKTDMPGIPGGPMRELKSRGAAQNGPGKGF